VVVRTLRRPASLVFPPSRGGFFTGEVLRSGDRATFVADRGTIRPSPSRIGRESRRSPGIVPATDGAIYATEDCPGIRTYGLSTSFG